MPRTLRAAVPFGTLPASLSTKFSESSSVLCNINEYHDGTSQRSALVDGGRRTWKLSKRLNAFQSGLLADFQNSMNGQAFYFYNPSETGYSQSPTNSSGRYLVRFNNDWSRTFGMSRFDSDVELIEVGNGTGAADIGGTDTGGGGTVHAAIVPINESVQAGEWLTDSFQGFVGYGPIVYGGALWVYGAASEYENVIDPGTGIRTSTTGGGMYRSFEGTVWIEQGSLQTWPLPFAAYLDLGAGKVTFLSDGLRGGTAALVEFDLATASYGAVTALSPNFDSVNSFRFLSTYGEWLHKLSTGAYRVLYGVLTEDISFTQTGGEIYYLDYVGGAWTTPTLLFGGPGNFYRPFWTMQDGDVIHVFSGFSTSSPSSGALGPAQAYKYWQIAPDGTASTPVSLDSALTNDPSIIWTLQPGIISGNSLLIPAAKSYSDGTTDSQMGVLIGTPKGTPTFEWVSVGSIPNNDGPNDMKLIRLGSTDYVAWLQFSETTFNSSLIYIAKSTDHGATWSAAQLLLDLDATPPPPDPRGGQNPDLPPRPPGPAPLDIINFSLGTQLDGTSLGLMFTTTLETYWTNAPVVLGI